MNNQLTKRLGITLDEADLIVKHETPDVIDSLMTYPIKGALLLSEHILESIAAYIKEERNRKNRLAAMNATAFTKRKSASQVSPINNLREIITQRNKQKVINIMSCKTWKGLLDLYNCN